MLNKDYKKQNILGLSIVLAGFIASYIFNIPMIRYVSVIIYGLMFLINPVQKHDDTANNISKNITRVLSLILIVIGVYMIYKIYN